MFHVDPLLDCFYSLEEWAFNKPPPLCVLCRSRQVRLAGRPPRQQVLAFNCLQTHGLHLACKKPTRPCAPLRKCKTPLIGAFCIHSFKPSRVRSASSPWVSDSIWTIPQATAWQGFSHASGTFNLRDFESGDTSRAPPTCCQPPPARPFQQSANPSKNLQPLWDFDSFDEKSAIHLATAFRGAGENEAPGHNEGYGNRSSGQTPGLNFIFAVSLVEG